MTTLALESPYIINKTRDAVLEVLLKLGYKIQVSESTKILAHHPTSFRVWAHDINVELDSRTDKTYLILNIDHRAGNFYLKKFHKNLVKFLPNIVETRVVHDILYDDYTPSNDVYIGTGVNKKWFKEIKDRKILKSDEKMLAIIQGSIESSWGWGMLKLIRPNIVELP